MRNTKITIMVVSFILWSYTSTYATVYHVDGTNGNDNNDGLTRLTAFATIQRGIDEALSGDTVLVYPGIYTEQVTFWGEAITVKSAEDAAIVQSPGQDVFAFFFGDGYGNAPDTVLENFIITNSWRAIYLDNVSSPILSNLTIVNCDFGITPYYGSEPDIRNCIFWNNGGDVLGHDRYDIHHFPTYYCFLPDNPPLLDMTAHWKLDETSGTKAYDSSDYLYQYHHATLINGPSWTTGLVDGALDFDGFDDYIDCESAFESITASTTKSIMAWVKPDSISANTENIITFYNQSDSSKGFSILNTGTPGTWQGFYMNGPSTGKWLDSGVSPTPGEWTHLALVQDGSYVHLYINGVAEASANDAAAPSTSNPPNASIGAYTHSSGNSAFFDGIIDEIRIYDQALITFNIQKIYEHGILDAHWKFDETSDTTAYDSAREHDATLVNGPSWTTGVINGGALDFDGIDDYVDCGNTFESITTSTAKSLMAWVKPDTLADYDIININNDSSNGYTIGNRGNPGTWQAQYKNNPSSWVWLDSGIAPIQNEWTHLALVQDGSRVDFYVNGISKASADDAIVPAISNPPNASIGAYTHTTGNSMFFNGIIDDVQIYNRGQTAKEIQNVYKTGLYSPLLFADPAGGDFHLRSETGRYEPQSGQWVFDEVTSPCIDAGDPTMDPSEEKMPNGGQINAGAYGGTPYASISQYKYYISTNGNDSNDGLSWGQAFATIGKGLDVSVSGDEIWVAAGTYIPGTLRTDSFELAEGVSLYGGFSGNEQYLNQRNGIANETILSGDLAGNDDGALSGFDLLDHPKRADNSYRVLTAANNTVIDGFIIKGGNANDLGIDDIKAGGGIYSNGVSVTVQNCTIAKNSAASGGGMYNEDSILNIINCTFEDNFAPECGAMYNLRTALDITDSTFAGNQALIGGGGIGHWDGSLEITDCTFRNNGNGTSPNYGGAVYTESFGDVTLKGCSFQDNSCGYRGGAIYNSSNRVDIVDCTFERNNSVQNGGAIYSASGYELLYLRNCMLKDNSASSGGAIYNGTNTEMTNCLFENNTASDGAAVYSRNDTIHTLRLKDCDFEGNNGSCALSIKGISASSAIIRCIFESNNGDAVESHTTSILPFVDCVFAYNTGGAVYNYSSYPEFKNCVFTQNITTGIERVINNAYHAGSSLINCTIVINTVQNEGGAIYNAQGSYTTVVNSIIWANMVQAGGSMIYNGYGTSTTATYSCIRDGYAGEGNIDVDPDFVGIGDPDGPDNTWPTSDDGLMLSVNSPCVDIGNKDAAPIADILGRARGDSVDLGAYETQGVYVGFLGDIADLNKDGIVNMLDFAILGNQWKKSPGTPSADISPAGGDGIVDVQDLIAIADQWLY